MKESLTNKLFKTALLKASFFSVTCAALLLMGCGDLGPDPAADGSRFSRNFRFYYVQDCRYDKIGAYDCGPTRSLSPSMFVSLRVDSDGFATLNVDGDRYYYFESEYSEGYEPDYGGYFHFYQDDDELTLYRDGYQMAYWDTRNSLVTYYYYELY